VTGSQACRWTAGEGLDPNQYCLSTVLDGEVVNAAGINPGLANNLEAGAFDGGYLITASSFDEARELSRELRSGSLPTPVELERVDD
jgi:preprotein translocase subunit SecD